ncbi:hypothetical protein ACGFYV_31325 [Streptomyces sp. NPDC048297]|uniref:hypothetical protein n=1 Tax=Streptomyces sp. NPDC048297 TaxID=3365531 RepID=UPI00371CE65F
MTTHRPAARSSGLPVSWLVTVTTCQQVYGHDVHSTRSWIVAAFDQQGALHAAAAFIQTVARPLTGPPTARRLSA